MRFDGLTARQLEVARLVAEGMTDREIAARLSITIDTVDFHIRGIVKAWCIKSGNARVQIALRVSKIAA